MTRIDPLRVVGVLLIAGTALGTIVVLCWAAVALLALAEVGR